MTFEEKAEIVINQLRADRDRLQDAIEKIRAEIDEQTEIHSDGEFYIKNIDVKRILAKYAEQEPKTGHWIKSKDGYMRCNLCGSRGSAIKARFCHHCGARMVEPQESEDKE